MLLCHIRECCLNLFNLFFCSSNQILLFLFMNFLFEISNFISQRSIWFSWTRPPILLLHFIFSKIMLFMGSTSRTFMILRQIFMSILLLNLLQLLHNVIIFLRSPHQSIFYKSRLFLISPIEHFFSVDLFIWWIGSFLILHFSTLYCEDTIVTTSHQTQFLTLQIFNIVQLLYHALIQMALVEHYPLPY